MTEKSAQLIRWPKQNPKIILGILELKDEYFVRERYIHFFGFVFLVEKTKHRVRFLVANMFSEYMIRFSFRLDIKTGE